tara:strand:+ start:1010 stop:1273 length:264 start_codon:yes stop_codon:yes gene_type:complete
MVFYNVHCFYPKSCLNQPSHLHKNKAHVLLFALMMTVSLPGCFGGGDGDGDSNDETPSESLGDWYVHSAVFCSDLPECDKPLANSSH